MPLFDSRSDAQPPAYAELHALSAFSFRRSAAASDALVHQAAALGYSAVALTDECSMAGMVRAHEAARECGIRLIAGSEFHFEDSTLHLVLLAPDRAAWAGLCRLITHARRQADKGSYRLHEEDLEAPELRAGLASALAIWKLPFAPDAEPQLHEPTLSRLQRCFSNRLWLGASRLLRAGEQRWMTRLDRLARQYALPVLACGDVRMSKRSDKPLLDALTALRLGRPVADCGLALAASGEQHLRPRPTLARLYPAAWLEESLRLARRCHFSLDELDYRYPRELAPPPLSPIQHLRQLTLAGAQQRYGKAVPEQVRALLARELRLIEEMGVESFFLTVHDLVRFARSRGILCQGRGSAANSAVCFCLGITEVDPARQQLLFERFLSKERNEPPDIDVDFEHERREEVLQYIYEKYGRQRAALAATVICYRTRSAMQDAGRALGLEPERIRRLTASLAWWDQPEVWPERLRECGLDPQAPATRQFLWLVRRLIGLPRHLSQHVGGMVISDAPLHELVPVENAAMPGRTIIQWDKDDLETLGLLKVDCLALGMLTVIRKALDEINTWQGRSAQTALSLARLPQEDAATFDMLCRGDAVGVFQVESRAQMAMLPRLRPRCFYDLVVQVAIVRPGPIQGDMVHPYLKRRQHPEQVRYPSPELAEVLRRTLGVPIFQEQVMQIAMVAAGFSAGEADQLRRAMAAWRRRGGLEPFRQRLLDGMRQRGYDEAFAEQVYRQICGFGEYGFPESHAASFALLTWASAWLKCHHPAAFACALLNSQPMGFYAPAQIINDARRHGLRVLPVDVCHSDAQTTLVPAPSSSQASLRAQNRSDEEAPAIRLGLNRIRGLGKAAMQRILQARRTRPLANVGDLAERAGLNSAELRLLADANALKSLAGHRHRARWAALGAQHQGDLLAEVPLREAPVSLPPPSAHKALLDDYASLGLSLDHHPLRLLRPRLGRRVLRARELLLEPDGHFCQAAGLVTHRQRPGTASGVVFLSLEDESGLFNVIVHPRQAERYRQAVLNGRILRIHGRLQRVDEVCHLLAWRLDCLDDCLNDWLEGLRVRSRDFC